MDRGQEGLLGRANHRNGHLWVWAPAELHASEHVPGGRVHSACGKRDGGEHGAEVDTSSGAAIGGADDV